MERGAKEEIIGKQDGDSQLSTTAFELKRLWQDGSDVCGVCLAVRRGVERRIDALFYENVNDVPARQAIRQAGGFCRYHAGFILRQGDALGTAIILRDVLTAHLRSLEGGQSRSAGSLLDLSRLVRSAPGATWESEVARRPCTVCDAERDITWTVIGAMLAALENEEFAALFSRAARLCLGHYHLAGDVASDAQQVLLRAVEIRTLRQITDDLAELARKHDYRFADEPKGAEMRSWRTALNVASSGTEG
ncbi:MAG TPA: DUF6062 family protein [Chloroflexota bacterium]|nr:DUF6062 family protein [Chloroflexota bacterium]